MTNNKTKQSTETNRIKLMMCDWSGDGHNISEDTFIDTNLTKKEINEAYEKATELLGFSFCDDVASDYEDSQIEVEKVKKLRELGYTKEFGYDGDDLEDDMGMVPLDVEGFLNVYLFLIKLGNPAFTYSIIKEDMEGWIEIGGYGLFQP